VLPEPAADTRRLIRRGSAAPRPYDWVSLAFAVGGLVGAWGFYRFRGFDIVPIALDTVVESLDDAVIVLDTRHWIAHLNPAAQAVIGRPATVPITRVCAFPDRVL
jgi:PAS domain-containing protein